MTPECPRCRRRMEPGYVIDNSYGTVSQAAWVAGTPEVSRWSGLKLRKKEQVPVTTFRCARCGYLESYAGLDAEAT